MARRVPACLAIRESRNLIRREFFRNPCKTDALFEPQLSKQHEFAGQQMRRALLSTCLHSPPRFFVGSMKEDHVIVDPTCKSELKHGSLCVREVLFIKEKNFQ